MAKSTKNKPKIEHYHLHKDQPEKLQFEIYSLSEYLALISISIQNFPSFHLLNSYIYKHF
jgi:hypothetical protein